MPAGKIVVAWGSDGRLEIKTSLSVHSSDGRKEAIDRLLDAARALNNAGAPLLAPAAAGVRLLGGA